MASARLSIRSRNLHVLSFLLPMYKCNKFAVVQKCSEKRCSQTCNFILKSDSGTGFFCEFCKISKNTFSYRTPPVAASENCNKRYRAITKRISVQIESSRGFLRKRFSENMQQIHRRTRMPKCDFSYKTTAYFQNTFS